MEVRTQQIEELREKFFKKLDDEGPPDPRGFHPADISRVKNSNDWLKRFLEHHECNMQDAFKMLWETCAWRRKFNTNDITEDNVKREYLEDGVCFSHGKDKDGKTLFIIKSKLHVKGARDFGELQRCIVYWFERLEREENGNQISIFFDMAETGLSNLDMEFTNYLIGLFKSYYPNFLNYIIIFEMPWVLNAGFKIIKSWLPAKAIPKIKFVNKQTLKDYIDPHNALKCWGGLDDYVFTFIPEVRTNNEIPINGKLENRKVHFAENSPMTEQPASGFGSQEAEETLLSVEPESITFNKEGSEVTGTITLKNITADKSLSYKIKTTSPEKFRVRPSSGILGPNEKRLVTVTLQSGYSIRGPLHNDRFLIMCLPLRNANIPADELASMWKSKKPTEEHRLRCYDGNRSKDSQKGHSLFSHEISDERTVDTFYSMMDRLEEMHKGIHKEITILKYLLYTYIICAVFIVIVIAYIVYILRSDMNYTNQESCHLGYNHEI